jgi:hypothetical protein
MFFRVEYVLRDVNLAEGEELEFSEDAPHPTFLVIRRPSKDECPDLKPGECLATLNTEEAVTEKVRPQFEVVDPPRQAVEEIRRRITIRLAGYLRRVACVIRWRKGTTGHPNLVVNTKLLHWSDDKQSWKGVPGSLVATLDVGIPSKPLDSMRRASVAELVGDGQAEPLGHELFHEAWHQRKSMPRSSLLIGIAAAEVGFKALVSELVPHAEWLAMHAPTPPLEKMLKEYLPLLPVRQQIKNVAPFVPARLIETLKEGIRFRNETAHRGKGVMEDTLKEILIAVRDLLYLLDFYAGHKWTLELTSYEVQVELKAVSDKHNPVQDD